MKEEHRQKILNNQSIRKDWKLGKFLYQGVTENGFPWVCWETTNFGSILVGTSKDGVEPQSKLRNDARGGIACNDYRQAGDSADRMSREIVY